jgi:exopolysaccharide biosynthesis polyprenyl glycosylphosphotransferase
MSHQGRGLRRGSAASLAGTYAGERAAEPRRETRTVVALCFLTDLLVLWVALNIATLARLDTLHQVEFWLLQRDRLICGLLFGIACVFTGAYSPSKLTDRFDSVYFTLAGWLVSGLVVLSVTLLLPVELREISRRELVLGWAAAGVLLALWRYAAAGLVARFPSLHRIFYVLGTESEARETAEAIRSSGHLHMDARYVTLEALREKLERRRHDEAHLAPEDAIIMLSGPDRARLIEYLEVCEAYCRRTFFCPSPDDTLLFQHRNLLAVAGIPLVEVVSAQAATPYAYVKRCMDFSLALIGLLLASPLCLITAAAIKLTSPGPVFYTQERLGRGGRPFQVYKFRSMVAGVEARDETGHVLAQENDPRITPVGRLIRKHRIDEIPQLFNVLRGDMSLIGPRPVWREYYETNREELPLIERRLLVRPGLTSLSHILGSYTSAPRDRLRYDLAYISTMSLGTDLKILVETIRIVLSGKGAQ